MCGAAVRRQMVLIRLCLLLWQQGFTILTAKMYIQHTSLNLMMSLIASFQRKNLSRLRKITGRTRNSSMQAEWRSSTADCQSIHLIRIIRECMRRGRSSGKNRNMVLLMNTHHQRKNMMHKFIS